MIPLQRLTLVTDDPESLETRITMASVDEPGLTLGVLLAGHPAAGIEPLTAEAMKVPVADLRIRVTRPQPGVPVYLPPGMRLAAAGQDGQAGVMDAGAPMPAAEAPVPAAVPPGPGGAVVAVTPDPALAQDTPEVGQGTAAPGHPKRITEREAVLLAHREDIDLAVSYLDSGLSVLIRCEKLIVNHLAEEIAAASGRRDITLHYEKDPDKRPSAAAGVPGMTPSRRNELLDALLAAVTQAEPGDLVVVPHLDLLAGGSDATLTGEARELADALYESPECVLLAFVDPSLYLPEVVASRFDIRLSVEFLRRTVLVDGQPVPVGRALVTKDEAALFSDYDEIGLYKHVAGLNAVRLRHALRFAYHQNRPPARTGPDEPEPRRPTFGGLVAELRTFKAKTSNSFDAPDTKFREIGGYEDVKTQLMDALAIIGGAAELPEKLRTELVPRGFIFEGPPGTGKTLFAKAAASELGATILVVSGPEITDKYVGESERKIRELFNEARRNAPSVVVFDEFDSIAARRSGNDDGGARAGNAIVAQLLTELDGFRPEVPVLIIGTTNRVDLIDDALLRPSRFRPIKIGLPEIDARMEIARYHAGHFEVAVSETLLRRIAQATDQFSGDDIRSLFRDARAGELVGNRRPADAYRLGELVGELKRSRQQRQADRTQGRAGGSGPAGPRTRLRDTTTGAVPYRAGAAGRGNGGSPAAGAPPAQPRPAGPPGNRDRQPQEGGSGQ